MDPDISLDIVVNNNDGVEEFPPCNSFDKMGLEENLLKGIYEMGFERPSAIQQRGILPIKSGRDCIIQAQSGTGKTATFTIGLMSRIDVTLRETQVLILANTRELAIQIQTVVATIGKEINAVCKACIGGTEISKDIEALRAKPHIVVGTPGRVYDMIEKRQALDMSKLRLFILDEADEMLSRGFAPQIKSVVNFIHAEVQIVLVSATIPPDVHVIAKEIMQNPVEILVKNEELTLEGIRQYHIRVKEDKWKFETLTDIYQALEISQSVIFCNSRNRVEELTNQLIANKFTVSCIHGDMSQEDRSKVLKLFRDGVTRILISTDLLARGIDVQQVSLVINYDMPSNTENYLHRIGRGGRFGRKGTAINFVPDNELEVLDQISKHYHTHIPQVPEKIMDIFT